MNEEVGRNEFVMIAREIKRVSIEKREDVNCLQRVISGKNKKHRKFSGIF
jgi:hypothetical protein